MRHINPTSNELKAIIETIASQHLDVLVPYDELTCEVENSEENSPQIAFKYNLGTV